jgi:hypothetical protein
MQKNSITHQMYRREDDKRRNVYGKAPPPVSSPEWEAPADPQDHREHQRPNVPEAQEIDQQLTPVDRLFALGFSKVPLDSKEQTQNCAEQEQ